MRWPCSQNRFPTMRGKNCPFESGQSDVASPASWLVTSAPAMIKKNVAQATTKGSQLDTQPDSFRRHNRWSSTTTVLTTLSLNLTYCPFAIGPKTVSDILLQDLTGTIFR